MVGIRSFLTQLTLVVGVTHFKDKMEVGANEVLHVHVEVDGRLGEERRRARKARARPAEGHTHSFTVTTSGQPHRAPRCPFG